MVDGWSVRRTQYPDYEYPGCLDAVDHVALGEFERQVGLEHWVQLNCSLGGWDPGFGDDWQSFVDRRIKHKGFVRRGWLGAGHHLGRHRVVRHRLWRHRLAQRRLGRRMNPCGSVRKREVLTNVVTIGVVVRGYSTSVNARDIRQ